MGWVNFHLAGKLRENTDFPELVLPNRSRGRWQFSWVIKTNPGCQGQIQVHLLRKWRSRKIKKQGKRLFKRSLEVLSDNIFTHVPCVKVQKVPWNLTIFIATIFFMSDIQKIAYKSEIASHNCLTELLTTMCFIIFSVSIFHYLCKYFDYFIKNVVALSSQ